MTISEIREETEKLIKKLLKNHIDPEASTILYGGTYHICQKVFSFAFDGVKIQLTGTDDFLSLKEVHDVYMGIAGCRWCSNTFDGNFVVIDSFWDDQMIMLYKNFEGWWGCIDRFIVDKNASVLYGGGVYNAGEKIPGLEGPVEVSASQIEYIK